MESLLEKISYRFQKPALLEEALTHPSLAYEAQRPHFDNQRLEFLGDAVLQLVLTDHLFSLFPDFPEGTLTKLRSRLVSKQALMVYARRIDLGKYLAMGKGEESSGGRERTSALADAFEALIGAVYLDGGLTPARAMVLHLLEEELQQIAEDPVEMNPKGQLQEILQANSAHSPHYTIISSEGPDHCKVFEAKVEWCGKLLGIGSGKSKKEAETAAAKAALASETVQNLMIVAETGGS